jgi:RNA polymerase sigma-70 factor (ECF subfamily)
MSDHDAVRNLRGDVAFLDRLREGDDAAYNTLVRTYGAALIRYATGIVGTVETAKDVVQDVLLRLWRERSRIESSWDITAYLYGATRLRAIDAARSLHSTTQRENRWTTQHYLEAETTTPVDSLADDTAEVRVEVWNALAGVSPRCREAFMLVWDDELPYIEIAHRLGLTEPTVRTYVSRALKTLIDVLKPRYQP